MSNGGSEELIGLSKTVCARAQREDENIWLRAPIFGLTPLLKASLGCSSKKKKQSSSNVSCFIPPSLLQTEIAKRLNAILAQIMPFLSQEVSSDTSLQTHITCLIASA